VLYHFSHSANPKAKYFSQHHKKKKKKERKKERKKWLAEPGFGPGSSNLSFLSTLPLK
jgi:hypothetical protein